MRAHLFTSTSPTLEANLSLTSTAPLPPQAKSLAPNQSVVRVLATSINPADYKFPAFPIVGRFLVPRPSAPCIDFTGRVTSTGSSNTFKQGALVFGRLGKPQKHGSLGEYVVASSDEVVTLPQNVSVEDAACVGTAGLIAYQSIVPYVKEGDKVFINGGSGGTGSFGIQVAKQMGCWVTTTASSANVDFCKDLGADEIIDYKKGDVLNALKASGRTYQLVVDNVGTDPKLWTHMEQYTSPGAPFVQVGLPVSLRSIMEIVSSEYCKPRKHETLTKQEPCGPHRWVRQNAST